MLALKEKIIWFLAVNRNTAWIKLLRKVATAFVKGTENYSFNGKLNGEERVIGLIAKSQPKIIFDVGANRGEWAAFARQHNPEATIHCFELAEATFAKLKMNMSQDRNILLNDFGLGQEDKKIEYHFAEGHDHHSSIIEKPTNAGSFIKKIGVIKKGDSYAEAKAIAQIDFLKIDVEGAEFAVLKGFENYLKKGAIKVIQFEYGKGSIVTSCLLKDYYQFLESYNFKLGKIYPRDVAFKAYEIDDENFLGPNFLAVHESSPVLKYLS